MRRRSRKTKNTRLQTLTSNGSQAEAEGEGHKRFFGCCYLLISLSPRYKGHSYIGFTVNPKRRIRQHNGEITSGASTTKKKRPWEMVFCIHGFPTHITALQFEWAWQHPRESVAVREAAATFKTLGGLANKIKLALTMLTLPSWQSMDLTVSFFSTKYMNHTAGCPSLPHQMKLHFCSMDELPCYWNADHPGDEDDIGLHCTDDLGDDQHFSSLDGLTEVNRSSIDIQSCNVLNASEDLTWEQRGISTLESFSMVGNATLADYKQLLHLVPSGIYGSGGNSTNEQVRVTDEIWFEGLRDTLTISEEHAESFCRADPFRESPLFMPEEYVQPFYQFPLAGAHGSWENNMNERLQNSTEITTKGVTGSFRIQEEHTGSIHQVDLIEEVESSLMDDHVSTTEKFAKQDDMTYVLIDERFQGQNQPTDEQSPFRTATVGSSSIAGIEVIDLFTPSPDYRSIAGSNKRRVACDSPDIIDLTRSPLFVQL